VHDRYVFRLEFLEKIRNFAKCTHHTMKYIGKNSVS